MSSSWPLLPRIAQSRQSISNQRRGRSTRRSGSRNTLVYGYLAAGPQSTSQTAFTQCRARCATYGITRAQPACARQRSELNHSLSAGVALVVLRCALETSAKDPHPPDSPYTRSWPCVTVSGCGPVTQPRNTHRPASCSSEQSGFEVNPRSGTGPAARRCRRPYRPSDVRPRSPLDKRPWRMCRSGSGFPIPAKGLTKRLLDEPVDPFHPSSCRPMASRDSRTTRAK